MSHSVAKKRQQRARSARVLLSLYANDNLSNPAIWTWDALDRLPAWCLASAEERMTLQRTCGALYLSPELRLWIHKPALLVLHNVLGKVVVNDIMQHADVMQLPREPISNMLAACGLSEHTANPELLNQLLLAMGGNVLAATVHESLPREMLIASLQENGLPAQAGAEQIRTVSVDEQSAWVLHNVAESLLLAAQNGESSLEAAS